MNDTLRKVFIFVARIAIHGILWFISLFGGLFAITLIHPDEDVIIVNEFEVLYVIVFAALVSWVLGKLIRNLYEKKLLSKPKSIIEPIIPQKTETVETYVEAVCTKPTEPVKAISPLDLIDSMDGHTFEYWCADLLRDNGFVNVSVTRGSGDQGVDVLAEKEGIRYAIQCKCYSHDLGNTPVQEVNAGRVIYHCHIGAVMTNRYFTKGAKDAAEATGVLLWDRNWIKEHLKEAKIEKPNTSRDPLLWDALKLVQAENCATISIVQNGLGIGFARAARIIDELEELGYVGPFRGSTPREILWHR